MEEGLKRIVRLVIILFVAGILLFITYLLKDNLYETMDMVKESFSNLLRFS